MNDPGGVRATTARPHSGGSPGGDANGVGSRRGKGSKLLDALVRTPLGESSWGWWIAFAAVAVASAIDLKSRRIPNALTFPLAALALVANGIAGGTTGLGASGLGLLVGLGLFLLAMMVGAMGAGDVKLMAGLGALLGVVHVFWIGLFTCVMGGVLAVLHSGGRGTLPRMLRRTWELVKCIVLTRRLPRAEELNATGEDYMPYALAIALGVTAQYLYRGGS